MGGKPFSPLAGSSLPAPPTPRGRSLPRPPPDPSLQEVALLLCIVTLWTVGSVPEILISTGEGESLFLMATAVQVSATASLLPVRVAYVSLRLFLRPCVVK